MRSVLDAQKAIQEALRPLTAWEWVTLPEALNRILAEPIVAPFNVPAHDNAAMDGFAVRYSDLDPSHPTRLKVIGAAFAGHPFTGALTPASSVRIMTGAEIPTGADTIVPQEVCTVEGEIVTIPPGQKMGQHLRRAGEDLAAGGVALPAGRRLGPAELGLIGSLGIGAVRVVRRLRCAVLSTGDEIAAIGEPLAPGQIYDSNRHTLSALLRRLGCELLDFGITPDQPELLRERFTLAAENADVILTSGGVSVGEADFIRQMMAELGEVHFWQLAIKPGRPLAFGRIGNAWLFGLPGNPVAVVVAFTAFVRDALRTLQGENPVRPPLLIPAVLAHPIRKKPGRQEYLRATVAREGNALVARVAGAQGSGILSSMTRATGFLVLPAEAGDLAAGAVVDYLPFEAIL
ncbi:molybdopterin molybdotransferase MoeA [Hydrogenophilus islandicus]